MAAREASVLARERALEARERAVEQREAKMKAYEAEKGTMTQAATTLRFSVFALVGVATSLLYHHNSHGLAALAA